MASSIACQFLEGGGSDSNQNFALHTEEDHTKLQLWLSITAKFWSSNFYSTAGKQIDSVPAPNPIWYRLPEQELSPDAVLTIPEEEEMNDSETDSSRSSSEEEELSSSDADGDISYTTDHASIDTIMMSVGGELNYEIPSTVMDLLNME